MIWTNWARLWNEGAIYRECDPPDYRLKQTVRRERQLTDRRLELARLESAALRERLDEERLVADAVIRSMHMRIDRDEPIVRLATGLTFHPPGSLAHSQHLLELAALVEERRRHQRAPDSQEETPR